ncbi:MAG: gamma carbonic anhydrase family protein [Pseudomonadota bacterium]|nr:gamma carbonic anhydrase family protein [Pseudomonadota bacterium]
MDDTRQLPSFGPEVSLVRPAYVDPTARLYGKISLGEGCSLWPYSVIRAEALDVQIGRYVNMQDHSMIHIGYDTGVVIGDYCSITHKATIHGALIGENTLVGINATVMDGAKIGANCIVGGHCLVPEGMQVPDNSVVVGVPAKVVRTENNFISNRRNAMIYHWNAVAFAKGDHRSWGSKAFMAREPQIQAEIEAAFRDRYRDEAD